MPKRVTLEIEIGGRTEELVLARQGETGRVELGGRQLEIDIREIGENDYSLIVGGRSYDVSVHAADGFLQVSVQGQLLQVVVKDPRRFDRFGRGLLQDMGPASVTAPMPGKVIQLLVAEGETVEEGQGVIVIEAMKMQNELNAPKSGVVSRVHVNESETVNAGQVLVLIT